MNKLISGFQIVKTADSFVSIEPYNNLRFNGKLYEGLFRMHLYDVIEDYYNKKLTKEISDIIRNNLEESNDQSIELIKNYNDALKIFEFIKEINPNNEIIALKSKTLEKLKGSFSFYEKSIKWLGFDVISYGNGSLILDGIFFRSQFFEKWFDSLNNYGLFDSSENIDEFINYYIECSKKNIVDELPYYNYGFDAIAIGRVEI